MKTFTSVGSFKRAAKKATGQPLTHDDDDD